MWDRLPFKRRMTPLLRKIKRRKREHRMPDHELAEEAVDSSKNGENHQRVELPAFTDNSHRDSIVDEQDPQHQDTSSPDERNSQAEHLGATSESGDKRLKDMPSDGYQKLVECLEPLSVTGRDYRSLADRMGYTNQYIQYLGSLNSPVSELIRKYINQTPDRKITELVSLLEDMQRYDVLLDLQPFIDATPTPRELELRQQTVEENEELRTLRENYDAFICFAKKDKDFVKKLVKKMEGSPYKLHLCLSDRDFLGGGCIFETTAVAIDERCAKFVVILSSNFDGSEGASFESHIAMSLPPGTIEQRIIPVLIEEAYRTKIPRTIAHLTYLDFIREDEPHFWDRLARSLGWRPK